MKRCPKCDVEKQVTEFYNDNSKKDKRRYICMECDAAKSRDYRRKHHEQERVKDYEYYRSKTHIKMLSRLKNRAKEYGVDFNITTEWLKEKLALSYCEITGLPFDDVGEKSAYVRSIERKIPALGYTMENCICVVMIYNSAKREWLHQDVMRMAEALLRKQGYQVTMINQNS